MRGEPHCTSSAMWTIIIYYFITISKMKDFTQCPAVILYLLNGLQITILHTITETAKLKRKNVIRRWITYP